MNLKPHQGAEKWKMGLFKSIREVDDSPLLKLSEANLKSPRMVKVGEVS